MPNFKENKMEATKQMIVHALIGKGFSSCEIANHYTNIGFAKFTGDQWNEDWEWIIDELNKLTYDQLYNLYINI